MENIFLSFIIESTISSGIFYLLYWLVLKNEINFKFNRVYLLSSVITSFVIPFISFPSFTVAGNLASINILSYNNWFTQDIESINNTTLTIAPKTEHFQFIDLLIPLYLTIIGFLIIKFSYSLIKLKLLTKNNPILKKEEYTLVYFENDYSPFSFFRYIFLNHKFNSEDYLNTIIEHEKVHMKKHHSIDNLFLEIAVIIQWYNPFIWFIKKSLKEIHEFQVDEKVIAQGFDSQSYFSLILNKIVGIEAMDFANCLNKSLIKKRIMMMENLKSKKVFSYKLLLIIPVAFTLLAFTINFDSNELVNNELISSPQFEKLEDDIPQGWFKAGKNPLQYEIKIDENESSVLISSLEPIENDFGTLMQTISADEYIGKRIRFSGKIKTENAEKGASLWMRVDGQSKNEKASLAFDNMWNRSPKDDTDWTNYEIVLDVPENASTINYGMMLSQNGKAWFKNLNLEIVGKEIAVTDLKTQHTKSLPQKPVNLDFKK